MRNSIFVWLQYILVSVPIFAQDTIELKNPSFEDIPRAGSTNRLPIQGWDDCGLINFPGETPPDIHPVGTPAWDVSLPPFDGKTYLGMVTRYSNTYESVSQQLSTPLEKGVCYTITAHLSLSPTYNSPTRRSSVRTNFNTPGFNITVEDFAHPIELVIWGGNAT